MTTDSHHHNGPSHHAEGASSIIELRDKMGPIQRTLTGFAVSDHAGRGLRRIEAEQVAAAVKIAQTAIALETTKICTALTARAMPAIGAIAKELNTATSAVDASLSSASAGDVVGHIGNRSRNRTVIRELERDGQLNAEEAQILIDQLESDMATDIGRTRDRMEGAKTAVAHLHEKALSGIESAKSAIKTL